MGVNTAAIARPELIAETADRFGAQVLVLSADVRRRRDASGPPAGGFEVTTHGGRTRTGIDAVAWCARAAGLGAGEILLNSMDADGTKDGFDLELIRSCGPRSPCRSSRPVVPGAVGTSRPLCGPVRMPCSPPASSTSAS